MTELWKKDNVQFARLLSEMVAAGLPTDEQMQDLCVSMDLEPCEVDELLDRAQAKWEAHKQALIDDADRKQALHLTAKTLRKALSQAADTVASDSEDFYDWLADHFCSEERRGANIGPDVVNEFIDMVDRAVDDTRE